VVLRCEGVVVANRYDDAVRALCAVDLTGLCGWLGAEVCEQPQLLRLSESAPPASTRQLDLLVGVDDHTLLHVEFQTRPEARFAQRMLEYWLRIEAQDELRDRVIHQHVVLLGDGDLDNRLFRVGLDFVFAVSPVRHEDPERFLAEPGLVPLAALGRVPDRLRPAVLRRALGIVAGIDDPDHRHNLARATVELAHVRLDAATINRTWEVSAMPIPSLLNKLYLEGEAKGRAEGRSEGRTAMVTSLLRHRFGDGPGIASVAERLGALDDDEALDRIEQASSLSDLPG
jgi:hypothetical protein